MNDQRAAEDAPTLVVGGGIGGLTLAFRLATSGRAVRLIEPAERPGGAITTDVSNGWTFELGPNTVVAGEPAIDALIEDAGLSGELLTADRVGARRFVVRNGRMIALPRSPLEFVRSPILSPAGRLRLLAEPLVPRRRSSGEESIADFIRRRLGGEALDWLAAPFVSGVYAGDASRLSVRHALPRLAAWEADHGSLFRGMIAARRQGGAPRGAKLVSFQGGLATLPRRLADRLGDRIIRGTVDTLHRQGEAWIAGCSLPDGSTRTISARRVVLAVSAAQAARLLDEPELANLPVAGVRVAAFGFKRQDVAHPLDGFGVLVPRREGRRLLGALFPSSLFPGRAPDGFVGITAMAGGVNDPAVLALAADEFVAHVLGELGRLLGISAPPVHVITRSWREAIPQYELGHQRWLDLAERCERDRPGLHLLGSWRGGVSVPDRIRAATELAAHLSR
ncbi:MAG TPA: protoporphyrinogen oxidase [Candidatus Eisenbacteria bacterium]